MLKSGLTVARQPSAESLRHRNCPVVDQTSRPPVDQKYLEKGDSLLWYVRSSESLSWYRNCLDNSFLPRMRLFASSNTRIIQAKDPPLQRGGEKRQQGCWCSQGLRAGRTPRKWWVMRPCILICAPRSLENDH